MKTKILAKFSLLGGGLLLAMLGLGGCKAALAPMARAFGAPPESELAKCRTAFSQVQSGLEKATVEIGPVLTVDEQGSVWRRPLGAKLQQEVATRTKAKLTLPARRPTVEPTPFGHNQLRYLWTRAAAYSQGLQSARPDADYLLQTEIFAHNGKIAAIQVFLFAADGQVAYCRLFNSHHFGSDFRADGDEPFRFIVRHLFEDLQRKAEEVFPPHGVG